MSNPFNADFGLEQGRVAPAGEAPPAGTYVFQLGSDQPRRVYRFNPGDYHQVAQDGAGGGAITTVCSVRLEAVVRGAETMPTDAYWEFRAFVDGILLTSRRFDARARRLRDIGLNIAGFGGAFGDGTPFYFQLRIAGGTGPYDAELPGVAIDAFVIDEVGDAITVMNRDPETNEVNVPSAGPFGFDVEMTVDTGFGLPDSTTLNVEVDAELVIIGGVPQSGWASSTVGATPSNGLRVTLIPDVPLTSDAFHTIRVVDGLTASPPTLLDTSWTFKTEDLIGPAVIDGFATQLAEVRVTFSEPVLQVDAAGADDALNHANYTLTLVSGLPAVTPRVIAVTGSTDSIVLLTLDIPMTPWATYLVTVVSVADVAGNVIGPPENTAVFEGYLCPAPAERDFNIFEMFPEQDQLDDETGDLAYLSLIYQETTLLLFCLADRFPQIFDPDTAPEPFVDRMLYDVGNPFRFPMTLIEKRRLVQLLPSINRTKGTGPGMVDAIRSFMGLDITINVYAWAPYGLGEAYIGIDPALILGSSDPQDILTFVVRVASFIDEDQRRKIIDIVNYMKDAREFWRLEEPTLPAGQIDHMRLGFSLLNYQSWLH